MRAKELEKIEFEIPTHHLVLMTPRRMLATVAARFDRSGQCRDGGEQNGDRKSGHGPFFAGRVPTGKGGGRLVQCPRRSQGRRLPPDVAQYADCDSAFCAILLFRRSVQIRRHRRAPVVFVYGCLPVSTAIKVNDGSITLDLADDLYWDFEDPTQREKMVLASTTKDALRARMAGIRQVLLDSDKFKSKAQFYDPALLDQPLAIQNPRALALANSAFVGLLRTEAETITHARDAALQIAKFRSKAGSDLQDAIASLEEFGAKITDAFNKGLGGLIPRLEEFSALIFLEAARAFDPGLTNIRPTAYLDVILLKPTAPPNAGDDFLNGTAPDSATVAIEQPVVGLP